MKWNENEMEKERKENKCIMLDWSYHHAQFVKKTPILRFCRGKKHVNYLPELNTKHI